MKCDHAPRHFQMHSCGSLYGLLLCTISLQEQLTASLEIREEMEEIIKNLREELKADSFDGIRAELRKKEKIIRQIEEETSTFRSHIDKSRKELKREKKLLAQAKEDKNQVDRELEEKNKMVEEMKLKIDVSSKKNESLINALQDCKSELLLSQDEINELKDQLNQSKRALNEHKRKAVFQRKQAAESLKKMTSLYETMVGSGEMSTVLEKNASDQTHSP